MFILFSKTVFCRVLSTRPLPFMCYMYVCGRFSHASSTDNCKEVITIGSRQFSCDRWTNVTPKIISHIGRDLHLQKYHPLSHIYKRIVDFMYSNYKNAAGNPLFSVYDRLSPVVTTCQNFDSLLVAKDHPSRQRSDNYYINEGHLLRAHTSAHQCELVRMGLNNFLVAGDVYRRDEIDASHYPVFHQVEGVRLCSIAVLPEAAAGSIVIERSTRTDDKQEWHSAAAVKFMEEDLKACLVRLAKVLFGQDVEHRWVNAYFPFTHPSWELEVKFSDEWMEVLGCGIMEHMILQNNGAGDRIGWAFGLGLERLAMKLYNIPDIRLFWSKDSGFLSQFKFEDSNSSITYKAVSQFPQCKNDISFWLPSDGSFHSADFYDLVRSIGNEIIEQVELIDVFTHPRTGRTSHCYRIIYRHMEKTLTQKEVNVVHHEVKRAAAAQLHVDVR